MELFNFHTHNKNEKNGIINLFPEDIPQISKKYSIGLHPWYYSENYQIKINLIKDKIENKNIVALGETGFDTRSPVNINTQKKIFIEHINLSEKYNKPLIIHCVKYQNELIEIKKLLNPTQAWIIHGFTGKIAIAEELYNHNFYFSVSGQLLKDEYKASAFFDLIDINRLFFETDDKDFDLQEIYNFAAVKTKMPIEELFKTVYNNLKSIGL